MIHINVRNATQRMLKKVGEADRHAKQYKEWRANVLARDEHRCQFGNCVARNNLEVHHIERFADNPSKRFDTVNGITLCKQHHQIVNRQEQTYAPMFAKIVAGKKNTNVESDS